MINFDDVVKENIKKHKPNSSQIPGHPYRILIIGDSGSVKTNSLFNPINEEPDIDKIYLYTKDPYEAKYQFLIKKTSILPEQSILMIKKFLLNTQTMWMIFIKY